MESDRTILHDYLDYQKLYSDKYGEYTIVLMEIGSFFEIYGIETDELQLGKVSEISDLLNIQKTRKNKSNPVEDYSNPRMAGIPSFSLPKYTNILLNNNYTVVLIEQVTLPPKPKREVTKIMSPGTNIYENNVESNNLMSIYIEYIKQYNNVELPSVGISIIDSSVGSNIIFETSSPIDDKDFAIEEIFRMTQVYNPKEILINCKNCNKDKEEIISFFELNNKTVHVNINDLKTDIFSNNYQNTLLSKIFKDTGMLSPIEYLDLETTLYGLYSYIFLLEFAYEHDERILEKITKPKIEESNKLLLLTNNSIQQLNIVSCNNSNTRNNSLIGLINKTSTPMGKRLFKDRLLNPIIDTNILNKRYLNIENFISNQKYNNYEKILTRIHDIERLHRRMELGELHPSEFSALDLSYISINEIIYLIKIHFPNSYNDMHLYDCDVKKFNEYINEYTSIFDINNLNKYNLNEITGNIFNKDIYPEVDSIIDKINECNEFYIELAKNLSKYIDDKKNKNNNIILVKIESNDRDGKYLSLTKKRYESLIKNLKSNKIETIKIKLKNKNVIVSIEEIKLLIKHEKSNSKIFSNDIKNISKELVILSEQCKSISNKYYIKILNIFSNKFIINLKNITKFISEVDVVKSCAKTAIQFNYCKPSITNTFEDSYLIANEIRHPIIERINTKTKYIPNDVTLGTENMKGILLYSVNAAGKSSLMKSIGINTIMAQAGMYTAAKKFEFKPYKYIFTRISNNDNIFKGQSTYAVEIGELRGIIKRANNTCLVLGDELCSGTETHSAVSVVAAGIERLSSKKSSFIFATHLHQLSKLDIVNNLNNVKHFHLKVLIDPETKNLTYDRKLSEGSGSSIYGLEVCKAMGLDDDFLKTANKIRKSLLNIDDSILNNKKSKYNSNIYIDKCKICNALGEDIHHIKFQSTADENNMIGNYHMNTDNNLVCLCKSCHDKVHNKNLEIFGYKQTSQGIVLDYSFISDDKVENKKKNRRKYSPQQIEIIKEFQKTKYKKTQVKNHLKIYNNIGISVNTITKIWNDNY